MKLTTIKIIELKCPQKSITVSKFISNKILEAHLRGCDTLYKKYRKNSMCLNNSRCQ